MPRFVDVTDTSIARGVLDAQRKVVFDVRDYGAVCDGSTDDTDAIQDAIDAASVAAGGVVQLPPANINITTLRMKKNVHLRGSGWRTVLRQNVTNGHMIVLDTPSEEFTVISDMRMVGYKDTQATANDGINLSNVGGSGFSWYDTVHTIERVSIINVSGNGVRLDSGCRQAYMANVTVHGAKLAGFYLEAPDSSFVSCVSGRSGLSGFYLNCANGRFVGCKAYASGESMTAGNAHGFLIKYGRNSFSACEAQDNAQHGFMIYPSSVQPITLTGCIADSNGQTMASAVGFYIYLASYVTMRGCVALDRNVSPFQDFGLGFSAGCDYCDVDLLTLNNGASTTGTSATSRVTVNGTVVASPATTTMTLNVGSAINVGTAVAAATVSPLRVSLGGTYTNVTAGATGNQKLTVFDNGTTPVGLGISSVGGVQSFEYQVPTGWRHKFYVAGVETLNIESTTSMKLASNPVGIKVAVPATATSTGVVGQWAADASWFYVCTATNTWVRAALASW